MYASARPSLLRRSNLFQSKGCRVISGRRYAQPSRCFHASAYVRQTSNDPADSTEPGRSPNGEQNSAEPSEEGAAGPEIAETEDTLSDRLSKSKERNSTYGSAARRSSRNKRSREIPPVLIPEWFLNQNVRLYQNSSRFRDNLEVTDGHEVESSEAPNELTDLAQSSSPEKDGISAVAQESDTSKRYQLSHEIWNEIVANIRAGFSLPEPGHADTFAARKVHVLLQCPKDGGIYFLDSIVEKAASLLGADLIRLDAQDIAEIGGEYLGDGPEPSPYSIRSLAYDAQQVVARQDSRAVEDAAEEEEDLEEEEDADESPPSSRATSVQYGIPITSRVGAIPLSALASSLGELLKRKLSGNSAGPNRPEMMGGFVQLGSSNVTTPSSSWEDLKLSALAMALLESAQIKLLSTDSRQPDGPHQEKASASGSDGTEAFVAQGSEPRPTIVLIRDYKEMQSTHHGRRLLWKIHDQVRTRRKAGQKMILVGTVSSADLVPAISRSVFRTLQAEFEDGPERTIVVTPARTPSQESVFEEDERRRMREINMRHLQDMIRQRSPDTAKTSAVLAHSDLRIDSSLEYSSGLEESVWSFDRVHRVAVTALGLMEPNEEFSPEIIAKALRLLESSDEIKFQWAVEESEQQQLPKESSHAHSKASPTKRHGQVSEDKMKRIRKTCNSHEKKLLGGVVVPENIHTTFKDVHVPPETIEGIKTLTSLPLLRPEAFSYGVLATDKISGLLLYGPPGTGKTLLAKAVARESGAMVLEVSGSEVYDMYVGESEKNVKAIFTLAKKLSPCVVFIDEADAILGSRGGHSSRTSHRELINQFLREWDGMNEMSAFIMVATNRPFDLDEAVLRRLPRRMLVDLPVESDREAILRIHLKNERLDASISLSDLAAQTPFYSGSDLKNFCVAAAMACVREETQEAAAAAATAATSSSSSSPPPPDDTAKPQHQYPDRRTLQPRHFVKAMEEISASISEDMSSLTAIRKFDEKYGDRKGRRKRKVGWGFGSALVDAGTAANVRGGGGSGGGAGSVRVRN